MLTGDRVTLRAIGPDDYPILSSWLNDIEIELLGGGDPPTPRALASVTSDMSRQGEDGGAVGFAIVADDRLIGQCGLFHEDAIARTCELGITIGDRDYWGRGYGREAVGLLVDYAFRLRNVRKVWLTVNATNQRAIRAYAAVGFVEEGRLREHVWSNGGYIDLVYMGRLRERSS